MIRSAAFLAALSLAVTAEAQTGAHAMTSGMAVAARAVVEMSSRDPDGRLVIRAQQLPEG